MEKGEKDLAALWKKWGKTLGKRIPQEARTRLEADVEGGPDEDIFLKDLDDQIKEFLEKVVLFEWETDMEKYFSHRKKPKVEGETRYQRSFEKRLYLVRFVLATQSFSPRKRIDWEQVCTQWNKAHPNDLYIKKEVLKVNYYRALAIEDIQRICLEETEAKVMEQLVELFGDARKAAPIIDSFKRALRYAEEAEDIEDETEADLKKRQSMELTHQAVAIIKQQLEQPRKKLRAKEAQNERTHQETGQE
jgi:hypothetical protein